MERLALRGSGIMLLSCKAISVIVAIEEKRGREVVMTSKRRSSGTICSQRLRHYASTLFRAMTMIVAIEEKKGKRSCYDEQ